MVVAVGGTAAAAGAWAGPVEGRPWLTWAGAWTAAPRVARVSQSAQAFSLLVCCVEPKTFLSCSEEERRSSSGGHSAPTRATRRGATPRWTEAQRPSQEWTRGRRSTGGRGEADTARSCAFQREVSLDAHSSQHAERTEANQTRPREETMEFV